MSQNNQDPQLKLASYLNRGVDEHAVGSMDEEIKKIHAEVTGHMQTASLEEGIFQHVFMPFFADVPKEERKYPQVGLDNWIGVAGNIFREVDVIDAEGRVAFTVPPVADHTAVVPGESHAEAGGIMNMLIMTRKLQLNSPSMAKQYLDKHLSVRADQIYDPKNILKHLRTWNMIFRRYGYPPILELPGEETTTGTQQSASPTTPTSNKEHDGDWELA